MFEPVVFHQKPVKQVCKLHEDEPPSRRAGGFFGEFTAAVFVLKLLVLELLILVSCFRDAETQRAPSDFRSKSRRKRAESIRPVKSKMPSPRKNAISVMAHGQLLRLISEVRLLHLSVITVQGLNSLSQTGETKRQFA